MARHTRDEARDRAREHLIGAVNCAGDRAMKLTHPDRACLLVETDGARPMPREA